MHIDVVTLFPEILSALEHSITGRALKKEGLLTIDCWNPRHYAHDKHRTVDDRPYGGGPGMVMTIQPLLSAIQAAQTANQADKPATPAPVVYLSPRGRRLDQAKFKQIATLPRLILVAGRYEGIDERLIELAIDEIWSIGDYVLSGGEIACLVVIDCVTRLLPGALGCNESAKQDSFTNGLLDWPHYTRPDVYDGKQVPDALRSGDHAAIETWRLQQALGQTWLRRPDLLEKRMLSQHEQQLLDAFIEQNNKQKD